MTITATIEHHFDLISSRAEVFAVEIDQQIEITADQFDRAVMHDVERGTAQRAGENRFKGE